MEIKKTELINIIQSLKSFSNPKLQYEQYITDAIATADLLYYITFEKQDLTDNLVVDLGCGTGNLSIAAALLGASKVIAIDIDSDALKILTENAKELNLIDKIVVIQGDITQVNLNDQIESVKKVLKNPDLHVLTLSNPPFGVHNKGIDLLFIKKALEFSDIIYSIHLTTNESKSFLSHKIEQMGGQITDQAKLSLILKHTYNFHQKKQQKIQTDVFRIIKQGKKL